MLSQPLMHNLCVCSELRLWGLCVWPESWSSRPSDGPFICGRWDVSISMVRGGKANLCNCEQPDMCKEARFLGRVCSLTSCLHPSRLRYLKDRHQNNGGSSVRFLQWDRSMVFKDSISYMRDIACNFEHLLALSKMRFLGRAGNITSCSFQLISRFTKDSRCWKHGGNSDKRLLLMSSLFSLISFPKSSGRACKLHLLKNKSSKHWRLQISFGRQVCLVPFISRYRRYISCAMDLGRTDDSADDSLWSLPLSTPAI